jgi:hypothetical protein
LIAMSHVPAPQACYARAADVRATWSGLSAQSLAFCVINSVSLTTENRQPRTGGILAMTGKSLKETGCAVSLFCLFSVYTICADFRIPLKHLRRFVPRIGSDHFVQIGLKIFFQIF